MKLNEKLATCHDLHALKNLTGCDASIKNKIGWLGHTIEIYGYDDGVHVMQVIRKMHDIQMEFTLFDPNSAECDAGVAVCNTILLLITEYETSLKNECVLKKIACRIADFFQCFFSSAEKRLKKMTYIFESMQQRSKKEYHLQISKMFN